MATSTWGNRLRDARIAAGKSQTDIALEVGVSQQLVSQWERGTSLIGPTFREPLAATVRMPLRRLFPKAEAPTELDWWAQRGMARYKLPEQHRSDCACGA